MGARLALHVALRHPSLVERLIVLGATGGIDDDAERDTRRRADNELADSIERDGVPAFLDRWLAQPMFADVPDDREERLTNSAAGLASSLRLAGTGTQRPLWHAIRGLNMPVLVLAGANDPKFVAAGRRLADCIGGNAHFATIPSARHAAHLEQPLAFARIVHHFTRGA